MKRGRPRGGKYSTDTFSVRLFKPLIQPLKRCLKNRRYLNRNDVVNLALANFVADEEPGDLEAAAQRDLLEELREVRERGFYKGETKKEGEGQ